MGILGFLFGKPVKIIHPFFGEMNFVEDKKHPANSYFECNRAFRPSGKIINIGIDGDISGPTQRQVDLFKSIEENYMQVEQSITPMIEDEFRNWKEDFAIQNFKKEFEPVHLIIPRCETKPVIWEIAFEADHDRNHTFTLTMHDFEAQEILIDG